MLYYVVKQIETIMLNYKCLLIHMIVYKLITKKEFKTIIVPSLFYNQDF